jgi:2-octaprenylphenol hydroxylase
LKKPFNIAIVGGGVTGLMLAALLNRSATGEQLVVTVIDAAERPAYDPAADVGLRVSAISTGSAELLDSVGAWARVENTRASAYDRMRVWDESTVADGATTLRFDAAEFAVKQLGFIVENELLRQSLLVALAESHVEVIFDAPLRALDRSRGRLTLELEDGRLREADLIVGADGARSFVREAAGIDAREWLYEQCAFVTHLQPQLPHRNTAWQRFLSEGPLGMLPLADGRVSVVWSTGKDTAKAALAADDQELSDMLTDASDHVLGKLTVQGPRGTFPLHARHASRYVSHGVALIGDAAHAIHPLAGQGANLGLRDAARLAEVIAQALQVGEYPADRPVLRRYERARKGENTTMLHFMTGLNRLFTTDSALVRELRIAGMRLFNVSGPLREHAVGVALGVGK